MSFLRKTIRYGKSDFLVKDLLLDIPEEFEERKEIDLENFDYDKNYLFTFYPKKTIKIRDKIRISGVCKNKIIIIWHTAKLFSMIMNYIKNAKPLCFLGKISSTYNSFFPTIVPFNEGFFPQNEKMTPIYKNMLNKLLLIIKDDFLRTNLTNLHFPNSAEDVKKSLENLAIMEIAVFFEKIKAAQSPKSPMLKNPSISLPLTLTEDQNKAVKEIYQDLESSTRTVRVIYGDVGTGKTIVALIGSMKVIENGKQVVYMAPTSLLAEQVFEVCQKFFPEVKIKLITSQTKKKKNMDDYAIFVGTHALLYRDYAENLGYVIIDEQHKFGVKQRHKLIEKSKVDMLMMTATPIPRTFQMMLIDYISFSTLTNKFNKGFRSSYVINKKNIEQFEKKIIELVKKEKCIWVCKTIKEAEQRLDFFKKYIKSNLNMIHGKMKDKKEILDAFDKSPNGLLISTTVIEVGIDISINVIVIENAENFGYAQLHQLRGRVGRREFEGFCFFIGTNIQKLKEIVLAKDNFLISELDFYKRGAGILSGIEQSGSSPFKFLKTLNNNSKIIEKTLNDEILVKAKQIKVTEEIRELFSVVEEIAV